MNIDRLIDRIEKALREDTTTDPVYHALAKEYAKYRTQIDERLEHCVTLIRSGKDFAARELAEQPPDVLTLMEKLSFGNDGKWRSLCNEKDLYIGPNWAEEHALPPNWDRCTNPFHYTKNAISHRYQRRVSPLG